jgi:hypothetical protein
LALDFGCGWCASVMLLMAELKELPAAGAPALAHLG